MIGDLRQQWLFGGEHGFLLPAPATAHKIGKTRENRP